MQWVVVALLNLGMEGAMSAQSLRANGASAALWVVLTVAIFWLAERVPIDRRTWRWSSPIALAAAGAVVLIRALFVVAANGWIGWYPTLPPFSSILLTSVGNNFFLYWLVLGAGHALSYARRVRERDEQLAVAELQHLKAQLHPHFLFNTLNAISAFVRTEPETAVQMIARLSMLLRHALQQAGTQEVALEEELAVVAAYVDIEQLRFDDRLRVTWRIAPDVLRSRVPHLLLQPLVENAIRHGLAPSSSGGTVDIHAARDGDMVRLVVQDDGVGLSKAAQAASGIGLSNARRRLQQLYGAQHAFEVSAVAPHGLRVAIAVPYQEMARAAHAVSYAVPQSAASSMATSRVRHEPA